jgi:C-terminal peptidase prc
MTRATLRRLLGGLIVLVILALPLHAEESRAPRTYAVLIGVGTYSDAAIQGRPHAEADVQALYDLFTDKQYLGVPAENVRLLLGGAKDEKRHSQEATRENILKAAKWLATEARRDDLVLFAYIGQGAALGEHADRIAYFSTDSSVKEPVKTAVLATALGEELDKLESHRVAMFVDVYFKGYKPPKGAPADPNVPALSFFKEFFGKDMAEEEDPAPGRVLFLASGRGRFLSPDAAKHGTFTEALLDGLKGKADKEGYEPDGVVTVDELSEYLRETLPALVKQHVANEKERPNFGVIAGEDAHFVLTRDPAVQAKVNERLEKFAAVAKENKLAPDVVQQGKALLSRMPKLEAQRKLRKEYQALTDGKEPVDKFLANRAELLKGMSLTHDSAREFARTILEAIGIVQKNYVKELNRGQLVEWAIRGLYRSLDEHMPDELAKKVAGLKDVKDSAELRALLIEARERLGKREDLDNHKDIDDALLRMTRHLDPYTNFITPEDLRHTESDVSGEFIGVGIQVRKDSDTDQLQVITPIYGSPAFKAGIQAGDIVTTVTRLVDDKGKPLAKPEAVSTKGMTTSDAVKVIFGPPGSKVKLTVQRKGAEKPIDYEMERQPVTTESVYGTRRKADGRWNYWIDPKEKIAYVRLSQFQRSSTHDLVETMKALKKEGLRGLVLDLRFNPGGYLDVGQDIADLFIDDGVIVEIRPRKGQSQYLRGSKLGVYRYEPAGKEEVETRELPSYTEMPMAVLVNGHSASASEIVSAALQDHSRALVVGERTYGKGLVQQIFNLERDKDNPRKVASKFKVTYATYLRPNGHNIDKRSTQGRPEDEWGVTPDVVIPLDSAERFELDEHLRDATIIRPEAYYLSTETPKDNFKDKQLDTALEYLKGQVKILKKVEQEKKAG